MIYTVVLTDAAKRALGDLAEHVQRRITRWIDLLAEDPRRPGTPVFVGSMRARITSFSTAFSKNR